MKARAPVRSGAIPEGALAEVLVLCRPILGDSILAGPVFRNLRAWQPRASIRAVCAEGKRDFLAFLPEIDEVVELPGRRPGGLAGAARWLGFVRGLRARRFDLVYDMMQTDRSSLLCAALRSEHRVGFVKGAERFRHRVYTDTAPWLDGDGVDVHARDLYLAPLAAVGMPVRSRHVAVQPGAEDDTRAQALLSSLGLDAASPRVVCHPGASSASKCWPSEDFAAVCDELQREMGARVILVGGPAERGALRVLRSRMETPPAMIEGLLPLRTLAALLARADLFFGHDSGPMHVAAAVGTPTVGLFGASSPSQWRPIGQGHAVLRPAMPCAPCVRSDLCEPPNPYKMFCVRRLDRARVLDALRRQLDNLQTRRGAQLLG